MLTVIDEDSAWRSMSSGNSRATMCRRCSPICSPGMGRLSISGPTMAPNLPPLRRANGSAGSASGRSISSRDHLGEWLFARASTASCARRPAQWRDLLHDAGSRSPDRALARALPRSGRTARSATSRGPGKPSCLALLVCPTLRSGHPNRATIVAGTLPHPVDHPDGAGQGLGRRRVSGGFCEVARR